MGKHGRIGQGTDNIMLRRKDAICMPGDYRCADKSLTRPTSRCTLFDGENISFDASLVLYIYIYIYK